LSSILGFLSIQGDRILLGGLISAELLGVYTVSFFLANAVKDIILKLVYSVFFPLLSEVIREQSDQIQTTYYKIREKIDFVTMFSAGFLYSTGSLIISFLYDNRYSDAGWMMEVLSLSLISVGFMLSDQLFLSYGKSKYISLLTSFQLAALYILVPVMFYIYGLEIAIWTIALNPIIRGIISVFIMKKYYFLSINREVMFFPVFFIGLLCGEQLQKISVMENINLLSNNFLIFDF